MSSSQTKVTSKGQVTIPQAIRERLSIRTGDRLEFTVEEAGVLRVRRQREPGSSAGCGSRFVKGRVGTPTVEEMDAAVRRAVAIRNGARSGDSR